MAKRVVFVDFMRGFGIFFMIILHAFLYFVALQQKDMFEYMMTNSLLIVRIIAAPFIFLSLWGSFFCLLGGIMFIYRTQIANESGEGFKPGSYFLQRGLSGFLLILLQYIWLTLLSPKSTEHPGPATFSLFTGALEELSSPSLSLMHYSTTGMLESLGWIIIVLSVLGYFVYRKKKNQRLRFYVIFGLILVITVIISILFEISFEDPSKLFSDFYESNQIFRVIILLKLTGNRFSFFPLIAFGISGAILGFNLSSNQFKMSTLAILFTIGIGCIIGYIGIWILGFDVIDAYTNSYISLPLHLLNFGSQLVMIGLFYLVFKKYQQVERERDIGIVRFFNMFSKTSLTVYLLEALSSVLLFRLVKIFYEFDLRTNFYIWMGFLILNILVWYGILVLWRKINYKYSIEWTMGKIKEKIKVVTKSSQ